MSYPSRLGILARKGRQIFVVPAEVVIHIPPLRPLLVVPAKAGTQGFQSLAPLFMPGAGSGSPLARGRRIVRPQDFLTAAKAGIQGVSRRTLRPWVPAFAGMTKWAGEPPMNNEPDLI